MILMVVIFGLQMPEMILIIVKAVIVQDESRIATVIRFFTETAVFEGKLIGLIRHFQNKKVAVFMIAFNFSYGLVLN
jgi:hypothetical protein